MTENILPDDLEYRIVEALTMATLVVNHYEAVESHDRLHFKMESELSRFWAECRNELRHPDDIDDSLEKARMEHHVADYEMCSWLLAGWMQVTKIMPSEEHDHAYCNVLDEMIDLFGDEKDQTIIELDALNKYENIRKEIAAQVGGN